MIRTDTFNRADENPISTNWTPVVLTGYSAPKIVGGQVYPSHATNPCVAFWDADAFDPDHSAEVVLCDASMAGDYPGPAVRVNVSGAVATYYNLVSDGTNIYMQKFVAGVGSGLATYGSSCVPGDRLKLSVSGTSLTGYKNGTALGAPVTDSAISSGAPGLCVQTGSGLPQIAAWVGEDAVAEGAGGGGLNSIFGDALPALGPVISLPTTFANDDPNTPVDASSRTVVLLAGTGSLAGVEGTDKLTLTATKRGAMDGQAYAVVDLEDPFFVDGSAISLYDSATVNGVTESRMYDLGVVSSSEGGATADEVLDEPVEGAITMRQAMRALLALVSKCSGGGTATVTYRDPADTKDRIVFTVDESGNRTAVTLDLT